MALAVTSVFAGHGVDRSAHIYSLALTFFLIAIPSMLAWACLGAGSARVLRSAVQIRRFNRCMAILLFASAWMAPFA